MFLFSSLLVDLLCYSLLNRLSIVYIFYNLFHILLFTYDHFISKFFSLFIFEDIWISLTLINYKTSIMDACLNRLHYNTHNSSL